MPNIIERLQELEKEQTKREEREEEEKKKRKREHEKAVIERTMTVNRELIDKLKPSISILEEAKIQEILDEIRKIKKDLCIKVDLSVRFSDEEGQYGKGRNFDNILTFSTTEVFFPEPYRNYSLARSVRLTGLDYLEVEASWDYWGAGGDYGHSYIKITPECSGKGKVLKITDGRGENILSEEQLKSEQIVEDAIILAVLNPRRYSYTEPADRDNRGW